MVTLSARLASLFVVRSGGPVPKSLVGTIAVLSDIHGVLPVLNAVLDEPDVASADLVVVTGDHAAGPQPVEVLQRLQQLGERVLLVRGNADRELVALARGEPSTVGEPYEIDAWAASQLSSGDVALLDGLPHPVVIEVAGFGRVAFCHGTPRDDDEVVLVDTRLDRWTEVFADLQDAVRAVVCGHTHMPFVRMVDRRLVINPGSIGMPYGRAGGSWALLANGNVTLRWTPVDLDAAVAEIVAQSTYPKREEWADYYVRAKSSDVDALTAFAPRDGRDDHA